MLLAVCQVMYFFPLSMQINTQAFSPRSENHKLILWFMLIRSTERTLTNGIAQVKVLVI